MKHGPVLGLLLAFGLSAQARAHCGKEGADWYCDTRQEALAAAESVAASVALCEMKLFKSTPVLVQSESDPEVNLIRRWEKCKAPPWDGRVAWKLLVTVRYGSLGEYVRSLLPPIRRAFPKG